MIWYDVIGYAGAAFIVTSLAMRSRVKMRWLGIIGALLLAVYGVLIAAWPVTIAWITSAWSEAAVLGWPAVRASRM